VQYRRKDKPEVVIDAHLGPCGCHYIAHLWPSSSMLYVSDCKTFESEWEPVVPPNALKATGGNPTGMYDTYWLPTVQLWCDATFQEFMAYRTGLEWALCGEYPATDPMVWSTNHEG
jgi:hypothetical protein